MIERDELKQMLAWIVGLRWIGIIGPLAAAPIIDHLGWFSFSLAPLSAVLGFAALYNATCSRLSASAGVDLRKLALVQILLDQLTITLAVHFSGGCDSPFISFFIFHIVICGIIFPRKYTFVFGSFAVFFPALVMGLIHSGVLPRYRSSRASGRYL